MKRLLLFAIFAHMTIQGFSQDKNVLTSLLESKPEYFGEILKNAEKYRLQIIYTQIDRDKKNRPTFTSYGFRNGTSEYFYPASTVKFPASLLALEKINNLKIKGLSKNSTMLTDAEFERHTPATRDTTSETGLPSVGHYIKKILMVSDNDAFNRLYEFVGQEPFNETLHQKGYKNARIIHRLEVGMTPEQNRRTNPVRFFDGEKLIYQQPMVVSSKNYIPDTPIKLGKGYLKGDSLVNEPFDFTAKNYFPLNEQQAILKAVLFPEAVDAQHRFNLTAEDYKFLYQYMSQYPTESTFPAYGSSQDYFPAYCKFLLYGGDKNAVINPDIRIFNKVGDAYGFLLDNAYIVDFEKGIEFMLTAVILCNHDEIFNDSQYDYEKTGFPFMKHLGQTIYDFELTRPKKVKPDLRKFKMTYDK